MVRAVVLILRCSLRFGMPDDSPSWPCCHSCISPDTLRTHIQGLVSLRPEWDVALSSFRVEGAWIVGDWQAVEDILAGAGAGALSPEVAIAKVLVEIRSGGARLPAALRAARLELGRPLNAAGRHSYQRSYDSVVQLHMLHELELIATSSLPELAKIITGANTHIIAKERVTQMKSALDQRLGRILPSFRAQEPILSMRRTAFDLWSVHSHSPVWLLRKPRG
jgi:serine/threonine-protein kinase ATR